MPERRAADADRLLRRPPGGTPLKKARESMSKPEIASREEVLAMLTEKARKGQTGAAPENEY